MFSFACDYLEGAHERLLSRLMENNRDQVPGYGQDPYTHQAVQAIRRACACPEAEVYFTVGGTQTNKLVIDSLLTDYRGVVAADTAHINTQETGAVESCGHKILSLANDQGKLSADQLQAYLQAFEANPNRAHMVAPGMVYITYPSELGTLYSKADLQAIYQVCQAHDLPLYIDGARLGYGLMSPEADLTLAELAHLCDVFYIGANKIGALCGEAVVFSQRKAPAYFPALVKKHGGLVAKGRLLGIQFEELFKDGLYFDLSRHAVKQGLTVKEIFAEAGYSFYTDSYTNQQFVCLSPAEAERLADYVGFSVWNPDLDGQVVLRFVTSWATTDAALEELRDALKQIAINKKFEERALIV
ncbi:beta-eliminating lyase-related protein [Aerococcus sp. UMB7834]|uniref:threonine aldolase family protein n=1 Tax=Aerococcus sp. UMB7834 TaxID=3046342 RepID=UPI002550B3CC|nr:beta-eliminating lyase-related protein [Aerococcus sp. UMB7834]MDK6805526.1 beta-eliminating lyase-related protein [Aerococcus sp. UMB7834]